MFGKKKLDSSISSKKDEGKGKKEEKKEEKKKSKASEDDIKKEGFILKKSSKSMFGISKWQKRYIVLEKDKLTFYSDDSKKEAKKFI